MSDEFYYEDVIEARKEGWVAGFKAARNTYKRSRMMRFTNVIAEDNALKLFDELHKTITGSVGYEVSEKADGSGRDDIWYTFRTRLTLSMVKGLAEDGGVSSHSSDAVRIRDEQIEQEVAELMEKFGWKGAE